MKKAKTGVRVLVTRPKHQQDNFTTICNDAGFDTVLLPCIDILPVNCALTRDDIEKANLIFFTSRNAVEFAHTILPLPWSGASVYAIGRATERALNRYGQQVVHPPIAPYNSEAFIAWHENQADIQSALIIKGIGGRDLIETYFKNKQAEVIVKAVYKRITPVVSESEKQRIFVETPPHVISVTSDDALRNLVNIAGSDFADVLHAAHLVVNSQRCADMAIRLGFDDNPSVASPPGDEGQLQAIIECLPNIKV